MASSCLRFSPFQQHHEGESIIQGESSKTLKINIRQENAVVCFIMCSEYHGCSHPSQINKIWGFISQKLFLKERDELGNLSRWNFWFSMEKKLCKCNPTQKSLTQTVRFRWSPITPVVYDKRDLPFCTYSSLCPDQLLILGST